jgi:hypothetical protein
LRCARCAAIAATRLSTQTPKAYLNAMWNAISGCHFQRDCMLFVSSANHNLYLLFIIGKFLVFFSITSFLICSMKFRETRPSMAMMHFTRNSSEQKMIWVTKMFPSVICRDWCEGCCFWHTFKIFCETCEPE